MESGRLGLLASDAAAPEVTANGGKNDPDDRSQAKDAADIAEDNEEDEAGDCRLPFLFGFDQMVDARLQPDAKEHSGDDQNEDDGGLSHRGEEYRLSLVFHDVFLLICKVCHTSGSIWSDLLSDKCAS